MHDSRILREGETLAELGYAPLILGVVSEHVTERHAVIQGLPIIRLAPTSPFSWARSLLARARPAQGRDGSVSGRDRGPVMRIAVRLHRWMRTLDFYRRAIGVVREQRPALIHCNDYNTMWVGVAARVVSRGSAVVYDSHELWADRNLRSEPRWWLLLCEALFVRCAHRTITASPGYAAVIARRYRVRQPGVVRNIPVGPAERVPVADGPPASSQNGEATVVYVGALTTGRGLEVAIKAMALLKGVRLRIVGPARDGYEAELTELARREGVAERVEFAGAVAPERVLEAAGEADVGLVLIEPICLSYRMSLPNKLFEYVAAGVPVLGSDLPEIGRLIGEHGIGLVAQPDQVADIASKLTEMLRPERSREFRLAVRRAAEQLSWQREALVLAETYAMAAESAGRPLSD